QSASELWSFLFQRHMNRGAHAQVLLLRDLLQLRFDASQPLAPQAQHALRLCAVSLESAFAASSSPVEPFLFDSGASTHLSPLRSDFDTFQPISPRGVRGVNGSVIYATGIGKIRLSVGR
ncbi:hypothetical protein OH77DRAFT_1367828, partial [Trametes cingulata]